MNTLTIYNPVKLTSLKCKPIKRNNKVNKIINSEMWNEKLFVNKNVKPSISDMKFINWAPEVINGRLAMLGMFSGLGYETVSGISVLEQPYALSAFVISSVLITCASLIAGNPNEQVVFNKPFMPDVELLNGRVAMLGMLAYVINQI